VAHKRPLAAIAVMYFGRIVKIGPAAAVLSRPRHPYSWLLLDSVPNASKRREPADIVSAELPSARASTRLLLCGPVPVRLERPPRAEAGAN
jgi:ABC-type dipeptide/oligopeptide/nickel transport system ATPase component